jgi:hypothetical protein
MLGVGRGLGSTASDSGAGKREVTANAPGRRRRQDAGATTGDRNDWLRSRWRAGLCAGSPESSDGQGDNWPVVTQKKEKDMKMRITLISGLAEFVRTRTGSEIRTEDPDQKRGRRNQVPKTNIDFFSFHRMAFSAVLAVAVFACVCKGLAADQVFSANGLTVLNIQGPQPSVDFVNAKPMPLPINDSAEDPIQGLVDALLSPPPALGPSGYSPGVAGTGKKMSPVFLGTPAAAESGVTPEDFGTSNLPFTTVRADLYGLNTNTIYPYSAAGMLVYVIGTSTYYCSASLIKPGIVVTAAHCVANYGKNQLYKGFVFVPGYRDGSGPFGKWTAQQVYVKSAYLYGTDGCLRNTLSVAAICPDDVAVIVLKAQGDSYPGIAASAGSFAYAYGFKGFTSNSLAQITEIGYAGGLDKGEYMERNDSQGYVEPKLLANTIIGSNMNGGSSGAPWLVNFGLPSALTGETNGGYSAPNVVVGVTSWVGANAAAKVEGASPFTNNNIQFLVSWACSATPAACKE